MASLGVTYRTILRKAKEAFTSELQSVTFENNTCNESVTMSVTSAEMPDHCLEDNELLLPTERKYTDPDLHECSQDNHRSIIDTFLSTCVTSGGNDLSTVPAALDDIDEIDTCDSDNDTETEDVYSVSDVNLITELSEWASSFRIPLVAVSHLLSILKKYHSSLPLDARTLLKTTTKCVLRKTSCGGEYSHVGLLKGICENVKGDQLHFCSNGISLQFGVDGLPLYKSSSNCLWPIMCTIKEIPQFKPFLVGVYHGTGKPASAEEFLQDFVSETSALLEHGIQIDDLDVNVKIHSFVCDAPARAFLKGIKSHSGYSACEKCKDEGVYSNKVIYSSSAAPLRHDCDFERMQDVEHHLYKSPLLPLNIGCVTQFGLDYMHLVCLGVMRRLILYWKGPVGPLHVRLGGNNVKKLSLKYISLSPHIPAEFARRPRSLQEILRWKATEFRLFLLYTGFVALKEILPVKLYENFMLLMIAIRILISPELAMKLADYAGNLLSIFVQEAETLYGKEILVYNVHSLLHLSDDVKRLGCLDNFSAFPFENMLQQLKKMIRKHQQPVQQVVRRLSERKLQNSDCTSSQPTMKCRVMNGHQDIRFLGFNQYRCCITNNWKITGSIPDNCVQLTDGSIVFVSYIFERNGVVALKCRKLNKISDSFDEPLPSSCLGIVSASEESLDYVVVSIADIKVKCVCLPESDSSYVVLPMLHKELIY